VKEEGWPIHPIRGWPDHPLLKREREREREKKKKKNVKEEEEGWPIHPQGVVRFQAVQRVGDTCIYKCFSETCYMFIFDTAERTGGA
jgi:hypothetical protein